MTASLDTAWGESLRGRVAVVTGGASGLGKATAALLAASGASVAILDVDAAAAAATAKEISEGAGRAIAVQGDVTARRAVEHGIRDIVRQFGRLDVLCNAAGVFDLGTSLDVKDDERPSLHPNVHGTLLCVEASAPVLFESGNGSIVSFSPVRQLPRGGGISLVGASIGALASLTRSLAVELGPHGVRVNAIAAAHQPNSTSNQTVGDMDDAARVAVFLAGDNASFISGAVVPAGIRQAHGLPPR